MSADRKIFRCAVYTRKSSDNNLDLEFNSLDAQREAAEAYIKSQAHEGWRLVRTAYDDGGISGGTMERPALQRLLADVAAGAVDIIVVYKVDRLTRSLADFARLVDLFERHGVSFVSVTQQFNTTTSMGRLTLNVLLSFAQFEREVAGERIRDKVAASRRKGIWMGGTVPLGYVAREKKLVPDDEAAAVVRNLFCRYKELGCVGLLREELIRNGPPPQLCGRGRNKPASSGEVMSRGALYYLLRNRTYLGEARHRKVWHPGDHPRIVDPELFDEVQRLLDHNRVAARGHRIESEAPMAGLLFDDRGNRMSPTWTSRRGGRYRYYVSQALLQGRKLEAGTRPRVAAVDLEDRVFAAVAARAGRGGTERAGEIDLESRPASSSQVVGDPGSGDANQRPEFHDAALPLDVLRPAIARVVLRQAAADVELRCDVMDAIDRGTAPDTRVEGSTADSAGEAQPTRTEWISVPLMLLPQAKVTAPPGEERADMRLGTSAVVETLAKARVWARAMTRGTIKDFAELAVRTGHSELYVRRLIRMAWLAPGLVEGLAAGAEEIKVDRQRLIHPLPLRWRDQRELFGKTDS